MDSPEDGSSCEYVSMETFECGGGLGPLKDYLNQRVGHSTQEQVSHVETRGVLMGATGNPHMLVLETMPLRRDAWKPK